VTNGSAARIADGPAAPARAPEYRYHLLRAALAAGQPGLAGLDQDEMTRIAVQADKTFELEALVLGSPAAADVVIPEQRLVQAMSELMARYSDLERFLADLFSNGLNEEILRSALNRELIFDATMRRVAAQAPAVNELDVRLFYELHLDRFTQQERRTARHILITVNEDYMENQREPVRRRIEALRAKLRDRPNRFPSLARRYSECPSAMQDGRLGRVSRGQLYDSLDAVLFQLPAGAVSQPVESELGYHLVWCEKIHPARTPPFSRVQPRIRQLLVERAGLGCQRAWIAELKTTTGRGTPSPRQ
jgi:peptidyl-prolyl cis-trans isomerase C